jgi:choline kinase
VALRAAVLAAGRGVRMGGREPKTLIPVGNGEPMLHYILKGLRAAGIEDLLVVTGFRPAAVESFVRARWDADVSFVRNARFASWGNFHSLRLAIDQSPGVSLVAVNSDIVVHPRVFERVRSTRGDLVLAVQRRPDLEAEDMRVEVVDDRAAAIGKGLAMERSHGEFCGVSMLSHRAAAAYADVASGLEWSADTSVYYEDVYARILHVVDARWAPVEDTEYAEVDKPADLEGAARVLERHADAWQDTSAPPQGEPAPAQDAR